MTANRFEDRPGSLRCVWVPAADGKLESYWVEDTPEAAAATIRLTVAFHRLAASLEPGYGQDRLRRAG